MIKMKSVLSYLYICLICTLKSVCEKFWIEAAFKKAQEAPHTNLDRFYRAPFKSFFRVQIKCTIVSVKFWVSNLVIKQLIGWLLWTSSWACLHGWIKRGKHHLALRFVCDKRCFITRFFRNRNRHWQNTILSIKILQFNYENEYLQITSRVFSQLFEKKSRKLLGLEARIAVCHPEIPGSNLVLDPPKSELKNCPLNFVFL